MNLGLPQNVGKISILGTYATDGFSRTVLSYEVNEWVINVKHMEGFISYVIKGQAP
jgi:hypothetical protein